MKFRLFSFLFSLCLTATLFSQSDLCQNGYLPFREGVSFEITSYNQKGKVASVVQHAITEISPSSGGFRATVEMQILDDKGKDVHGGRYFIDCGDNGFSLDMSSMLNPESLTALSSLEVDVTGDGLSIPNTLVPGQKLPDGEMQIKASMNNLALITMSISISDRNVIGKETLTTPAGTFACVKLTQTTTIGGLGNKSYTGTTWLAPGVGTVRSENYNKKGEVESYTELTKFNTNN
jgi:hypothetical protein